MSPALDQMTPSPTLELSRDAIVAQLEREARRRLQMSAEEFITAYRTGRLPLDGRTVVDLLTLAHLLNTDDPLFAAL